MLKKILPLALWLTATVAAFGQNAVMVDRSNSTITYPLNFWTANALVGRTGLGFNTNLSAFWDATNAVTARTAIGALATNGNGSAVTNLTAANITGTVALASNVTGTIAISNGGSGATTAGGARTNLGLGTTNDVQFNQVQIGSDVVFTDTGELQWLGSSRFSLETMEFYAPILFNNATNAATTRTNLSLGWPALTNSNAANALLGYTTNFGNVVMPSSLTFSNTVTFLQGMFAETNAVNAGGTLFAGSGSTISFYATEDQSRWRTNLGLGWPALTNTSTSGFNASLYGSGTNPVLYNTNGEVVSPTNFWQAAPITTTFIESQPSSNSTTNINPARFLHIHSLTPATTVTNTIVLPTNTLTFEGDVALVVHKGPTNALTKVRTSGSTNDLVTMNRFDESVEFVYYNSVWQFNHNRSFVEPIYFSGTNAAANRAASRTNLGGTTVGNAVFTATNAAAAATAVGLGASNDVVFNSLELNGAGLLVDESGFFSLTVTTNFGGINFVNGTTPMFTLTGSLATFATNVTVNGNLTLGSGDNIVLSTTNGTKIGTATNQLIGFYNQTPITQPSSTGVTTNGFTAGDGGGDTVHAHSTFTGGIGTNAYTISDVVAHLKSLGLLAP